MKNYEAGLSRGFSWRIFGALALVSVLAAVFLVLFINLIDRTVAFDGDWAGSLRDFLDLKPGGAIAAVSAGLFLVFVILYKWGKELCAFLYTYRLLIAVAFVALSTVFEVNGTSIGALSKRIPGGKDEGIVFGVSQEIRSDEYAVSTPFLLAQYQNDFGYFNDLIRATPTDMYTLSGSPVKNPLIIFRPTQIGFLFLSPERGMAFYWSSKLAILALLSFELGLILTKRSKSLATVYMVMICISPGVQWWYFAAFFMEMMAFGQATVVLVYYYLRCGKRLLRWLLLLMFGYCGTAYLLVLYPAWQIPFFYVFVFMGFWLIVQRWSEAKAYFKKDFLIFLLVALAIAGVMLYYISLSLETIEATVNTFYPAHRKSVIEDAYRMLFKEPGNFYLGLLNSAEKLPNANQPENAVFYSVFPSGLFLSLLIMLKGKRDLLLEFMLALQVFFAAFVIFIMPEQVSKYTLMSYTYPERIMMTLSYINVVMLVRSLRLSDLKMPVWRAMVGALLAPLFVWVASVEFYTDLYTPSMLALQMAVVYAIMLSVLMYSESEAARKFFIGATIVVCVAIAGFINPIRVGLDSVYENSLFKEVQRVASRDPNALWISDQLAAAATNIFPAAGAKTLNATNTYPDMELYHELDPNGDSRYIYNRYAHVNVSIQNSIPTKFEFKGVDKFVIYLNMYDLKKLGVKYIASTRDLTTFNNGKVQFTPVSDTEKIFKVDFIEQPAQPAQPTTQPAETEPTQEVADDGGYYDDGYYEDESYYDDEYYYDDGGYYDDGYYDDGYYEDY